MRTKSKARKYRSKYIKIKASKRRSRKKGSKRKSRRVVRKGSKRKSRRKGSKRRSRRVIRKGSKRRSRRVIRKGSKRKSRRVVRKGSKRKSRRVVRKSSERGKKVSMSFKCSSKNVCRFTGLKYKGYSCYQDSVLLALFAVPNNFIKENILEKRLETISSNPRREIKCGEEDYENRKNIQDELKKITKSIRGEGERVEYCSDLRNLFRRCESIGRQRFYDIEMQDAGEFLQYLFAIFEINNGIVRSRRTYLKNDMSDYRDGLVSSDIKETITPILDINMMYVNSPKEISSFLNQVDDVVLDKDNLVKGNDGKFYMRRVDEISIVDCNFLVFYTQRRYIEDEKIVISREDVVPNEFLEVGKKRVMLYSIVVWERHHYTCYIKCDEKWYYYNDLDEKIRLVGSYKDMLDEKPNVKTNGVLYFYKVV